MRKKTMGIHHITSIVGDAQENIDFYAGILGLRFIKQTVNFDDPKTYHLYFGDKKANPGTAITFFPWPNRKAGQIGGGQVGITRYMVAKGSLGFWEKRLMKYRIPLEKIKRFGDDIIQFKDYHGLVLEIVERTNVENNPWEFNGISSSEAIKGFDGIVLYSTNPQETKKVLEETMGLIRDQEDENYIRFKSSSEIGNIIELKKKPVDNGSMGPGTVHHIAWRAKDEKDLLEWQSLSRKDKYMVTEVRDRNYFKSIYFREKGGILFEIATDGPGFTVDEDLDDLGKSLKLPKQYEKDREKIRGILSPIEVREI